MKYYIPTILFGLFLMLTACGDSPQGEKSNDVTAATKPNIIIIYADDLGYGDVAAYGSTTIATPNMDRLANNGMRFTNGYASSATCTPSRYALLTGIYPWRNKNAKILPGTAPLLIDTSLQTLPKMLKTAGYHTGIVGKWHLGLGNGQTDWNSLISPGPNEVGFDYSYIMAATQDRVPTVYIRDGRVVGLEANDPISVSYKENFPGEPTGKDNPELLKMKWHHGHNQSIVNGIPRIGYMQGGEAAKWVDEDMADDFLREAQQYVKNHKEESFFLYYALQQPHVPRTPHPRFVGTSGMGPRGDVIVEADWCIGEFLNTLEEEGLLETSLIVFSSDNGPVLNDGYYDDAVELIGKHEPSGGFRGGKYSLFEAGTRVPFITHWPDKITPGSSDALVGQLDLFNSIARLVGSDFSAPDSQEMLETFLGGSKTGRDNLILEATSRTALRQGSWVMIPPYPGPPRNKQVNIETASSRNFQLYDLTTDPQQKQNLAEAKPDKVAELLTIFEAIRGAEYGQVEALKLE